MARVEQAIFTSAQTERSAGYHLVAVSPGASEEDQRALAAWGPSHDSLLAAGAEAASLNFHPLPSGASCVSRTTPAGWEYSGRGGHRVYTHCLIVPPGTLARFANHPFSIARAALAAGTLEIHDEMPRRLESLELPGRAAAVDQTRLARLAAQVGPRPLALLLQAVMDCPCLAVGGLAGSDRLMAGLLDCLPPECRVAVSFSTGLKFSSRRPFRVVALPADLAERRWLSHQAEVQVMDLTALGESALVDGWARLVERALSLGKTSFLAAQLSKPRGDLAMGDLPALGLQLLEELEATAFHDLGEHASRARNASAAASEHLGKAGDPLAPVYEQEEDFSAAFPRALRPLDAEKSPCEERIAAEGKAAPGTRAHAAHERFQKSKASKSAAPAAARPSQCLDADSPAVLEKLEALDDAVFDAMSGKIAAIEELQCLWPALRAELGDELLTESREQYLRYALSIWDHSVEAGAVRDPARAVQALEVLCVLFDDA